MAIYSRVSEMWQIKYDNDTGWNDESFCEWWDVYQGDVSYRANTEEEAKFLCDTLNATIPTSIIDLTIFMCNTWAKIDTFVYEHCDGSQIMQYPVIQGTKNQINLDKIGKMQYDNKKIHDAVNWLLENRE